MSKFIRLLQSVRRGGREFGLAPRQGQAPPSLAVIALLPNMETRSVEAALAGGADAIVATMESAGKATPTLDDIKELVGAAGDKPFGLAIRGTAAELEVKPADLARAGVDFLLLTADQSAGMLSEELDEVIQVKADYEPTDIRALDALGFDAFLLTGDAAQANRRLTVAEVVRYRLLTALTGKPVLLSVGDRSALADLEVIRDVGVEGIALEPALLGKQADSIRPAIAAFRDEIARLGPRRPPKRRGREEPVLLPHVTPSGPPEEEIGPGTPE
ncbi:MAG: hypothetical protein M0Z94_05340 [Dehalococcoidales bacterium]|nr:hypothetical protein [Dehalococcoidales bacterium]